MNVRFRVIFMNSQFRAGDCPQHCAHLSGLRVLPATYPAGKKVSWSAVEMKNFKPVTKAICEAMTTVLSEADTIRDPTWDELVTCLSTNNHQRSIINAARATVFGRRTGKVRY